MKPLPRLSLAEQTAAHLRQGILAGRWSGELPGVLRLAEELAVAKGTVRAALRLLEMEGSLVPNRPGQARSIAGGRKDERRLRVGILLSEPLARENNHSQTLMNSLRQAVEAAGHACFFAGQSMLELGHRPERVARVVRAAKADAWVVYSPSHEVLQWFVREHRHVFSIGGRIENLPVAYSRSNTVPGIRAATTEFLRQGHRRLVLIAPMIWRKPQPNLPARAFLDVLTEHQLRPSSYNLPDWDESPEGLRRLLNELFFATPPTGLLVVEPAHALAVYTFLASRGLRVPEHVSLFCALPDPVFEWQEVKLASLRWPSEKHVLRVVRWLRSVSSGQPRADAQILHCPFEPGGTIGPAKAVSG